MSRIDSLFLQMIHRSLGPFYFALLLRQCTDYNYTNQRTPSMLNFYRLATQLSFYTEAYIYNLIIQARKGQPP